MQTLCFLFVRPTEVEGVADIADDEARDKRMLDIARDEHAMIGWSSLRIRGPEMDRILAILEKIFAFEPDALAQDLIAGRFPGRDPRHVWAFSYVAPETVQRLAARLVANPEQDEQIDADEEIARVYASVFDALEEAARRGLALVIDATG